MNALKTIKSRSLLILLALVFTLSLSPLMLQAESTPLPDDIAAEEAAEAEGGRELNEPFELHFSDPSKVTDEDQLIYYFYKEGCPWCDEISALLAALPREVPTFEGTTTNVKFVGMDKNFVTHGELIEQFYEDYEIDEDRRYVPMLVIGEQDLFLGDEIVPALLTALFEGEGLTTPRDYLPTMPQVIYLYDEICAACNGEETWEEAVDGYLNLDIEDHFELRFINRRSEREAADKIVEQLQEPIERYPVIIFNNEVLLSGEVAIAEELVPMLLEVQKQDAIPVILMEDEPSEMLLDELYVRIREDRLTSVLRLIEVTSDDGKALLPLLIDLVGEAPEGAPALLVDGGWIVGVTPILEYLDAQ